MVIFRGLRFKPDAEIVPFGIFEMASIFLPVNSTYLKNQTLSNFSMASLNNGLTVSFACTDFKRAYINSNFLRT
jgi:hypothetical protein